MPVRASECVQGRRSQSFRPRRLLPAPTHCRPLAMIFFTIKKQALWCLFLFYSSLGNGKSGTESVPVTLYVPAIDCEAADDVLTRSDTAE